MNAMQKMTEGMIKENQPKFEVGDTCLLYTSPSPRD